jgi:hypothetical protein
LILPSHQLGFTLTVCFPTQLLEVCPYTRESDGLHTYHLLSTICLSSTPGFSEVHFSAEDASQLFLQPRNTIENA